MPHIRPPSPAKQPDENPYAPPHEDMRPALASVQDASMVDILAKALLRFLNSSKRVQPTLVAEPSRCIDDCNGLPSHP